MVEWVNSNQGFVMTILTFVSVTATVIIVILNGATIREMKKTRDSEYRPYIYGQFTSFSDYLNILDFQIRNNGKTGGIIKQIIVTPELPIREKLDSLNGLILAPRQTFNIVLHAQIKDIAENKYTISIVYKSIATKQLFKESYELPLIAYGLTGHSYQTTANKSDEANALKNIASILSSMNKRM